jgi:hypothetical protein
MFLPVFIVTPPESRYSAIHPEIPLCGIEGLALQRDSKNLYQTCSSQLVQVSPISYS